MDKTTCASATTSTTMSSPWDHIIDETYNGWLIDRFTKDEFNGASMVERGALRSQFLEEQDRIKTTAAPPPRDGVGFGPFLLLNYCNTGEGSDLAVRLERVQTLPELREKVASILDVAEASKVFLFGGHYNKGSKETDFVRLSSTEQLTNLKGEDDKPILLRYAPPGSKTPPSSPPQDWKEVSSEEVQGQNLFCLPVSFAGEVPDFYGDKVFRELIVDITNPTVDNPLLVLTAVPGAAKTRTVKEAAIAVGASYHCEKFTDTHDFILDLRKIAEEQRGAPESYQAGKDVFVKRCKEFVLSLLDNENKKDLLFVLHFDEVQLLMGDRVVSRKTEQSENLFDYVMPAFGDAINCFTANRENLRVALSGTNFFLPLSFNSGPHLIISRFRLEGGFPLEFGKAMLQRYFRLESIEEDDLNTLIEPMCANRRALQYLAFALEEDVGVGGYVSKENLSLAAKTAYEEWCAPIKLCVGNGRNKGAMSLLALIMYPSAWKAVETDGKLMLPADELPWEVREYALGGAVNVYCHSPTTYKISVPVGCNMRFLCDMCNRATLADNMKELQSFRTVSRSVGTGKGHFFERLVAFELTFFSSKLYKTLLLTTGMEVRPDPRIFGKSFVCNPRIHEADWSAGAVFVHQDVTSTGQRLVDVGFPVTECASSEVWKVFCELKVIQDKNELWKMCSIFFQKMQDIGVGESNNRTIAVFLSFHEFMTHKPVQKEVINDGNVSAYESRDKVLTVLKDKQKYFAVVDASSLAKAGTVLPLADLYGIIDREEPTDTGVTEISNQVAGIYTSSSQEGPPVNELKKKRLRIS